MPIPLPFLLTSNRAARGALPLLLATFASAAHAQAPMVVTDLPATHALASAVMEGVATPSLIVTGAADPHHFQLKPSQARALSKADVVFWIGESMTPWLASALPELAPQARSVALLDAPDLPLLPLGEAEHEGHDAANAHAEHDDHDTEDHAHADHDAEEGHDHADHSDADHTAEEGHDHADHSDADHTAEEGHDHGSVDPHIWLDPANAQIMAREMVDVLSAQDPDNAATYARNLSLLQASLATLTTQLRATLAPYEHTPILTTHDAIGYFARAFELHDILPVSASDASKPGAAHLSALGAQIAAAADQRDTLCLLAEPQQNLSLARAITGEVTVEDAEADLSGTTLAPGADLYATLLTDIAAAIATCTP
ncbi:High-affinity zinc uptake system protein ZnuA precursor [Aquimixticola soesokkakensis]|uniref:High-affinity zinc uptake system protein ZnuA n=1 Tax=Aquimixticola soesokkakensis TaxID=1519096 RepID=A0A1Y5RP77_9RHOB|nr:zinc ABC transporter substrate-binding protein [Aquimixticola soesokkakensis]SLN19421.1 High-affinity zinc uptake system protein ZnuA precursor [Aquimixticola soesokkakensis]